MSEMLEWALKYAEKGIPVFPLMERTKEPATLHGCKDATTDESKIRKWWTRNPNYNIGVATGSGLVAIDVDDKPDEGKFGSEALRGWEKGHGEFLPTWTVVTGTGGLHYWYKTAQTYSNAVEILGAIDVRSQGGYVVAPPSVHPNGLAYEWEASGDPEDIEISELSGSALEFLENYASKGKGGKGKNSQKPAYKDLKKIEKGHRQEALMSLQGTLVNMNLSTDAIKAAVREENSLKCEPPFTEAELAKIIFPFLNRSVEVSGDYTETVVPSESLDDGIEEDDLIMPTLDQIDQEDAEWLEVGYIPKKTITILCGTGGVGKTSIWCSIAAAISRGEPSLLTASGIDTGLRRENRKVMFFSAEDSVGVVLKKKLVSAHAVQKNINFFDVSDKKFKDIQFSDPYLEKLIAKYRPALCVFDPIQAFINKRVKMSDRNAMRQEVEPLIRMGQRYETTFLLVMHTNKQSNVWGRQRMADSADLWDVARSVLMVGDDTSDKDLGYISQEKNSYARQSETVIFKITDGIATWHATSKKKDKDFVLEASKVKSQEKSGDIGDACNFILSAIAEAEDNMISVKDLDEELRAFGYSNYAIRNAKKNLKDSNLIFYRKSGYEGKSYLCTHKNRQD